MPFVAGNEIEAHCPKCNSDREHTVMVVHGGLVHEVRCTKCSEVHAYKRPLKPKKPTKAKKAAAKPRKRAKKAAPKEQGPPPEWQELVFGRDAEEARPYSIKETFGIRDFIFHSKFGLGVVTELHDHNKLSVAFKDGMKKLIHGRV